MSKQDRRDEPSPAQRSNNRTLALEAAKRLFIEEGYAAFSMRKVARAIGISQGHLQHFFPTRDDLVNAMLQDAAAHYIEVYETILGKREGDPVNRFNDVVRFLLDDITNREVTNFFFELWPMTAHNETAGAMLRNIYRQNCVGFSKVIRDMRPECDLETVEDMALQILSLIDGLILFCHSAGPDEATLARVKRKALHTIEQIVSV